MAGCTLKNEQCEFLKCRIKIHNQLLMSFLHQKNSEKNIKQTKKKSAEMSRVYKIFGFNITIEREFDPGSGRTLAACLTHASRTRSSLMIPSGLINEWTGADRRVTRE